jgi:predicted HAD superfamily Cof-like phosphohydrolase
VTKLRDQVLEFSEAFGVAVRHTPGVPDDETVRLRLRLIAEEFLELLDACNLDTADAHDAILKCIADYPLHGCVGREEGKSVYIEAFADACADLDYVVEGSRLAFGIDGEPIADEVHAANMRKLGPDGKPIYRESDRKVIKPKGWVGPNHEPILIAQGWQP